MTMGRVQPLRSASLGVMAAFAALVAGQTAQAQSMLGFDPYRPYTGSYEVGALPPSAAMNFDAVNAARSGSYSTRANQMSSFYDELYGPGTGLGNQVDNQRRIMRPGVSYNSAQRLYDKDWGRVYTPNKDDGKFYEDQKKRTEEYFKEYDAARKEKDPKKRRDRLRALELETLTRSRERAREVDTTPRTGTRAARPGARGASTTAPAGTRTAPRTYSSRLAPGTSAAPGTTTAPRTAVPPYPTTTRTPAAPGSASPSRSVLPPASNPGSPPTASRRTERPSEVLDRALRTEPNPRTQPSATDGAGSSATQPPR